MSNDVYADIVHMMSLGHAAREELANQAEYERGIVSLRCIIGTGISEARLHEIVKEVATSSPHENHLVPGHLDYLLKNKWLVEGTPEQYRFDMALRYPSECAYGCLAKFLALLEAEQR